MAGPSALNSHHWRVRSIEDASQDDVVGDVAEFAVALLALHSQQVERGFLGDQVGDSACLAVGTGAASLAAGRACNGPGIAPDAGIPLGLARAGISPFERPRGLTSARPKLENYIG
jgi:hypothetical protein